MAGAFRVVTTPAFEREFRKLSHGNATLIDALEGLIATFPKIPTTGVASTKSRNWRA